MKKTILALAACTLLGSAQASADLFEPGEYDGPMLTLGVRAGFNSSNMASDDFGKISSLDSWGTGFDAGVVANLNLRDWIAIQPGFFFQSRSGNYAYIYDPTVFHPYQDNTHSQEYGHRRRTLFKVPVMGIVRLHPVDQMVWSLELGPVFNFGIGGHEWWHDPTEQPSVEHRDNYYDRYNRFMMGLKMGTGIELFEHYYVGVHYEAGLRSAMKNSVGGHDKAWTFSLGYNF